MELSTIRRRRSRHPAASEAQTSDGPRYRTISFRLSEEDYQTLRVLVRERRISGLSALIRFALNRLKRTHAARVAPSAQERCPVPVTELIDDLDSVVQGLSALLSRRTRTKDYVVQN